MEAKQIITFISFENAYEYMRKENPCPLLESSDEGSKLNCGGRASNECPKTKNRWVIKTGCWRIKVTMKPVATDGVMK